MKRTWIQMGMPITLILADTEANEDWFKEVYNYFDYIDEKFSPFKKTSEVSAVAKAGSDPSEKWSKDMITVLRLSEETRRQTDGYFDIWRGRKFDPSGLVKGWAIHEASKQLRRLGAKNFYLEAGGDIQTSGKNAEAKRWVIGIQNPFKPTEIIKVVNMTSGGVATSGSYLRGKHIYNPKDHNQSADEIVSLTVIGKNIYEADRFATAAFAMGRQGIQFIQRRSGLEGYMVDKNGIATMTSGFGRYLV